MRHPRHRQSHQAGRIRWLADALLGANDGIVSSASLAVRVASEGAVRQNILAGVDGAVARAVSMATGEYVSVSSQADTEPADLAFERSELLSNLADEEREPAAIHVGRGLDPELAQTVAELYFFRTTYNRCPAGQLRVSRRNCSARGLQHSGT